MFQQRLDEAFSIPDKMLVKLQHENSKDFCCSHAAALREFFSVLFRSRSA